MIDLNAYRDTPLLGTELGEMTYDPRATAICQYLKGWTVVTVGSTS
jgi:hypothetical protein